MGILDGRFGAMADSSLLSARQILSENEADQALGSYNAHSLEIQLHGEQRWRSGKLASSFALYL
jgi:hypothetical protein